MLIKCLILPALSYLLIFHQSVKLPMPKCLVHAFLTLCIDCCNSFLSSAPKKITNKLQHVQNAAARLVTGTWKYERGLCRLMHDDLHWLVIPQRVQYKLAVWQSIVVFGTELQGISPTTVCQSLKLLVASTCNLPDVINCQFHEFAAASVGPVRFLSSDQESGIHCLIICGIQLLTANNLGETWRRICSLDIRSVSALEVSRNCTAQIDIYLLSYWCQSDAVRWWWNWQCSAL